MLTLFPGTDILVEQYSSRPVRVIAFHGWGRSRSDWDEVLRDQPALAVDLPGFGSSEPPATVWGTQEYSDYFDAMISISDRPVLVGHSFGGRIATRIASQHLDQVSGLVLTGVPLIRTTRPKRSPLRFRAVRWLTRIHLLSDNRLEAARKRYGSEDYVNASPQMRKILVRTLGETYSDAIDLIVQNGMPVRLVWGSNDSEVPLSVAHQIHDRIPHSDLAIVDGSGHMIDRRLAEVLRRSVLELVNSPIGREGEDS